MKELCKGAVSASGSLRDVQGAGILGAQLGLAVGDVAGAFAVNLEEFRPRLLEFLLAGGVDGARLLPAVGWLGDFDGFAGPEIALAPSSVNDNHVLVYSFDGLDDAIGGAGFVRRAILRGAAPVCPSSPINAKCGYGQAVVGLTNHFGFGPQILVTTWSTVYKDGAVHLYR